MKEKQEPPFAIQIELTEGCNLFCKFCGIRGIRNKPHRYKFMSLEYSKNIAKQIRKANWQSRIEFAMHGEPTMNPRLLEIIKVHSKKLKKECWGKATNKLKKTKLFKECKKFVKKYGSN